MKRTFALLLVVLMTLSLVACTAAPAAEQPAAPAPEAPAEPAAPAPEAPAGPVDYRTFKIDPGKIPQEKLDTTLYVAASVRGLDNPYIVTIIQGMDMFCQYFDTIGQKYEKQTLDSGGSNDKEVDNMKQFAAKANGNAIAYSDPNESAIAPALAEAMASSGGYIGTAWNKPDDVSPWDYDPNWVVHTSPDNVVGGYNITKALSDAIGGSGEIFVLEGMLGNTAATDRAKGLEKYLAENPNIKVVARDTANWDTKQALTLVETWLSQTPDVKGIWCANDNMATGAIQALDKAGLKGKVAVVGIDATTDMINAINEGFATATVSSNGYLQGGYTLAICYAAWAGLIDPTELPQEFRQFATPSMLVTQENVKGYIAEYVDKQPSMNFSEIFSCKAD
ncbi:MAG TPA: sugar ABC transporter substrate-binding protein [Feifaniaceae bacterium]|nr:sugar ABC transporter substrate-binding protein [Feifaniaceae bacterium]